MNKSKNNCSILLYIGQKYKAKNERQNYTSVLLLEVFGTKYIKKWNRNERFWYEKMRQKWRGDLVGWKFYRIYER